MGSSCRTAAFARLAEQYSLIRLDGKKPLEKGWQRYCTEKRSLEQINFRNGDNAGIATGPASGCLVLDIDDLEKFERICRERGWSCPATRAHRTGSGKLHLVFEYPADGKTYGNKSLQELGFDIRGLGGQVVAPGSIHPDTGGLYEVIHDVPRLPAPDWMLSLYTDNPIDNRQNGKASGLSPKLILKGVKQGARDETIFKYACRLRGMGVAIEEAYLLVAEAARNCDPPFPKRDAHLKVDNAYKKYSEPEQKAEQGAEEKPVCIEDAILTDCQLLALAIPEKRSYLSPWLNEGSINSVVGWRGMGKSLFTWGAVDAVTKGLGFGPWKCSDPVNCLILDGEMAVQDGQKRIADMGTAERKSELLFYSDHYAHTLGLGRANLLDEKWRGGMAEYMLRRNIKIWVCDNIASLAPGIDENSKSDWDPINQWLLRLRFAGITTILIHHEGKQGTQRGTSAREDNLDVCISLKRPSDYTADQGARFIVNFTKSRIPLEYLPLIADHEFQFVRTGGDTYEWTFTNALKKDKRSILQAFDEGVEQKDMAAMFGVNRSRISQVKGEAIKDGLLSRSGKLTQDGFRYVYGSET